MSQIHLISMPSQGHQCCCPAQQRNPLIAKSISPSVISLPPAANLQSHKVNHTRSRNHVHWFLVSVTSPVLSSLWFFFDNKHAFSI